MYKKPLKNECFFGIVPLRFVWHGEWSDPEILYKRQFFNYYDLQDYLYDVWKEENPLLQQQEKTPFEKWIIQNPDIAKGFLNDIIAIRKEVI